MDVKQKTEQVISYLREELGRFLRKDARPNIKDEISALLRNDDFIRAVEIVETVLPPTYNIHTMYYLVTAKDETRGRKIMIPLENVGPYSAIGVGGAALSYMMNLPQDLAYPLFLGIFAGAYAIAPLEWLMIKDHKQKLQDCKDGKARGEADNWGGGKRRGRLGRISDWYIAFSNKMMASEKSIEDMGWSTVTKAGYYLTQGQVLAYSVISFLATYALLK